MTCFDCKNCIRDFTALLNIEKEIKAAPTIIEASEEGET